MAPLVGIKAGDFMGPSGGDHVEYPGKLTWSVLISCVLGAMGGLIFGYDIGISGKFIRVCIYIKDLIYSSS